MKNLPNLTRKRRISSKLVFYIALMAFPVLQFCVFYIGVNLQSVLLAFQKYDSFETKYFVDWSDFWVNFKSIGSNIDGLLVLLKNSLIVWFFSSFVGTVGAVFFSYYIFKRKRVGKFFKFVLFIPSILPAVLMSSVFQNFANDILPFFLKTGKLLDLTETSPTVLFVMSVFYTVWIGFGTQVLLYSNAMGQISPSVLEAGKLDGVTPMQELWHVILPEVLPTVGTFLIAGVASAFMNQANLFSFFGGELQWDVQTLGYHMFSLTQNRGAEGDYPYLSALGLCCTLLAVPPTLLLRKLFKKFED